MSQGLLLREILSSFDFHGVDEYCVLYYADVEHSDNINVGDAVRIEFRHNGDINLALIIDSEVVFERVLIHNTVKAFYNFIEDAYNARN